MTREFNKQRRDNERPFSRNSSSGRHGEERSPHPARPRLNREMVDRGWETGARQNHADYRTRGPNSGQPSRDNWRRNQQTDHPSAQHSRNSNNRKPYGNRQDNYLEDTPRSNQGPRSRSFEPGMRNFDEQRYNERRGYSDRPGPSGSGARPRPGFRANTHSSDGRPQYGDRNQNRGYQRRDFDRDRDNRQARDFDHSDRDDRPKRSFDRSNRSNRYEPQPDTRNPRWQSRPSVQRDQNSRRPQEFTEHAPDNELFEGDYERFNTSDAPKLSSDQSEELQDTDQQEERHVTRLPDGHVLKGPRQVQRKNAAFWKDVAHETETLVQPLEQRTTSDVVRRPIVDRPKATPKKSVKQKSTESPRSRTRSASAVARGRKSRVNQSESKPKATGPRPSQRGFKWPKA